MKKTCDTIILGAGIYGMLIAKKLSKIYPEMKIIIIESKPELFNNNSSWNSGVLHSGVYYKPNSLKSIYCLKGNKDLKDYIDEHKLFLMKCGKLIVPSNEKESLKIKQLYQNGKNNGVELEIIDPASARKIDSFVNTDYNSLYLPSTSIGNPSRCRVYYF